MIEHIEIEGFKSLEKVSLDLGPLNIFVGTNGSGKTNFLEALRVLQGIGFGYTIDEILNGKPEGSNSKEWKPIRGGSTFAEFRTSRPPRDLVSFRVRASIPSFAGPLTFQIGLSPKNGVVYSESLAIGGQTVYECMADDQTVKLPPVPPNNHERSHIARGNSSPALAQVHRTPWSLTVPVIDAIASFIYHLQDVQALQPIPSVQREYSTASRAVRMGDRGEDFSALLKTILSDDSKGSDYLSWLKELTPAELDGIEILTNPDGAFTFAFRKGAVDYPARVLSDGTLRFAAIAAAFFQPAPPRLLLLEGIEKGLHPTQLQLLVELLKSQTGHGVEQVIATSYSPHAIAWLKEEDYKHVFLCTKNEETGATSITPFSEVLDLMELARTQPIADLFAEGWMENAF